jgi:predicted MFS family arabinose efflux permease
MLPAPVPPAPSAAHARYVLAVLFLVYAFNLIDRYLPSILLQDIKAELGASDTQMGFLTGPAFAVIYALLGIPIARWADRGSRRTIIATAVAFWSAMTALSGLARSFPQLALARVGVGVGEAGASPPAHSLISDYFPPERRARAFAFYAMGTYVGTMIAGFGGGWINQLYGWRAAFLAMGLPGLLLALLVRLTVREPARGQSEARRADEGSASLRETLAFLAGQRSYLHMNLATIFHTSKSYGFSFWAPAFLMRVHGLGSAEVGTWWGLSAIAGIAGSYVGGAWADRWSRSDARAYMWVPAIGALAGVPIALLFLLTPSPQLALLCFVPHFLINSIYPPPFFAALQGVSRLRMRSFSVAIHLLAVNLIGLGVWPLVVGMLNDGLHARFGLTAIRYSLLLMTMLGLVGCVFYLIAARSLRADLRRVSAEAEPQPSIGA